MHHSRFSYIFVALVAALLTACGGGGGGYKIDANPLLITSSSIDPTLVSGDTVDWMIPLQGGCSGSGPFVVEVIAGQLPDGVGVDDTNGRHHITGVILEDGNFAFTVKVTDSSCEPFATTFLDFEWSVAQGPVRIVGCNPPLIPNANFDDPLKYTDADALETVVYSSFVNYDLVVAGGQGPYTCSLVDDPTDPDDGALPIGLSFAVNSCSLVGTPTEVGPGGKPFRYTIRVTDAVGNTSERKFQHKIDTPPIIFATATLGDGKTGRAYYEPLSAIDGVPPLSFELLDNAPNDDGDADTTGNVNDNIDFIPGVTPSIAGFVNPALPFQLGPTGPAIDNAKLKATGGRIGYPAETDVGPDYSAVPMPPEGVYLVDSGVGTARIEGIPRRRGDFRVVAHAFSSLVPNERGQHAFRELSMHIDPSEPPLAGDPAFDLDPVWTVETTAWLGGGLFNKLPQFEVGKSYNPDGDSLPGLQLLAMGGVPSDGWSDAPHGFQRVLTPLEPAGTYKWSASWAGTGATPPAGVSFTSTGIVDVADSSLLQKIAEDYVDLTAIDHQLPNGTLGVENETTRTLSYSIGPDTIIVTYSSDSMTSTTNSSYYSSSAYEPNDLTMKIKKMEAFQSGPSDLGDLANSDLTHPVPLAAGLGAASSTNNTAAKLLSGATGGDTSGMDFQIGIINPTGWWQDMHGLNPAGGRHGSHADHNQNRFGYGKYNVGYYYPYGNWQPNVSAVEIPDAEGVSTSLTQADGVFTDGGRMYPFESSSRFGLVVVRENGKVYVPFAYEKDTTYNGFGDGTGESYSTSQRDAYVRTVQMTISPDGRIGAMKLKRSNTNLYEHAQDSGILLFSLTGEKVFGESSPGANDGETYSIIGSGTAATGTSTYWGDSDRLLYASSMALTNNHLYFLIGHRTSYSSYSEYMQSWSGHWLMRADVFSGADPVLLPSSDVNFTQAPNTAMQTTFHQYGPAAYVGSYGSGAFQTDFRYGDRFMSSYLYGQHALNFHEHTLAPTPFRVSRNGEAVTFRAAEDSQNGSNPYSDNQYYYSDSDHMNNWGWVDFQGGGAKRITNSRRPHTRGSSSGYTVFAGPSYYYQWGRYNGPTPGLEISDDGLAVACVYKTGGSTPYYYGSWGYGRENVLVSTSSDSGWGGFSESTVTATVFGGSHLWRFGALMFTADNAGLVFWGGAGMYNSTSSSYSEYSDCGGSFYMYKLGETNKVYNMLTTTTGGWSTSAGSTVTSFSPGTSGGTSSSSNTWNRFGSIMVHGGFVSKNRNFMYVACHGAITSGSNTGMELLGLNISSVDAGSINGHNNSEGFRITNWPSRVGFEWLYNSYAYWSMGYDYYYGYSYGPHGYHGQGRQLMAKDNGWVFWSGSYQSYTMSRSPYSGPQAYNTLANYYYYPHSGVHLYGFDADVGGPATQLSTVNTNTSYTSSPYESMVYMDTPRTGDKLMVVTSQGTNYYSSSAYYRRFNRESIIQVSDIDFDATSGAMHGGFSPSSNSNRLEGTLGRAGEAMAFVGETLFYTFKAAGSNETALHLSKAEYDSGAGTWTKTALSGPTNSPITGRIHVLGGGR